MRIKLGLIVCFFVSTSLFGQGGGKQYSITGVDDGLDYCVFVNEDLEEDIATFSVNENTIKTFGVRGIENVTIHSSKFLEIKFVVRGGSGVGVRQTILLCVSQGKIYTTLAILSEATSRVTDVYEKVADSLKLFDETEEYRVAISINQRGDQYKAVLHEVEKIESKFNPSRNVSFEKTYELNFDPSGYFFYNSVKRLNKRYKVYSVKENKAVERSFSTEAPCIELHQGFYVLIDNEWCANNGGDTLSCR